MLVVEGQSVDAGTTLRDRGVDAVLRATYRRVRAAVVVVAVALAATLVSVVTVDLGPSLRQRAERAGSNWLDRPMHIGRLGVHIARGEFVIEDLRIEGLTPDAPPWLVAKRIDVGLTWSALFHREVLVHSIEMADWKMVVQSFANGRHNWPRLNGPPRAPRTGPRPVVTTMQFVRATRGEFVFDDYGSRWAVDAPNLEVTVGKVADYRGRARFTGGTIHFQDFAADVRGSVARTSASKAARSCSIGSISRPMARSRSSAASWIPRAGRRCSTR